MAAGTVSITSLNKYIRVACTHNMLVQGVSGGSGSSSGIGQIFPVKSNS